MRRTSSYASAFLIATLLLGAGGSRAATPAGSWNGWITDDGCDPKNATDPKHKDCALNCVDTKGKHLVLYSTADKHIYVLDKQGLAREHLGHEVTVTGKLEGKRILVESIVKKAPG